MHQPDNPVYLDCAATTPIDPRVRDVVLHYMDVEFGNPGSRTHRYGQEAADGIKRAREQVAAVVDASPNEIIFTSGATEANNLAILGLKSYAEKSGKRHIISSTIEHNAVLEPLNVLARSGFEIDLLPVGTDGRIDVSELPSRLRDDTLLVSIMHTNNEIGTIQPIPEISTLINKHDCLFHVDAAQGFGKDLKTLCDKRIDLISASAHKLYAPKGVGCLIIRRTRKVARHITPLLYGGGQERGLRPGTLATPLVCGFGAAAELALNETSEWHLLWDERRAELLDAFSQYPPIVIGSPAYQLGNIISFALPGIDSEALLIYLKPHIALSNSAACTSSKHKISHVLDAIGLRDDVKEGACRASFCHMTPKIPVQAIKNTLQQCA